MNPSMLLEARDSAILNTSFANFVKEHKRICAKKQLAEFSQEGLASSVENIEDSATNPAKDSSTSICSDCFDNFVKWVVGEPERAQKYFMEMTEGERALFAPKDNIANSCSVDSVSSDSNDSLSLAKNVVFSKIISRTFEGENESDRKPNEHKECDRPWAIKK